MGELLRRNRRRLAVLVVSAVVLVLALRELANPAPPLDLPASLASTAWQVSAVDGRAASTSQISVDFEPSTARILGRCNRLLVGYQLRSRGQITFELEDQPAVLCDDKLAAAFESSVILALPLIRQATILPTGELELTGSTRAIDLRNIGTEQPVVESPGT